MECDCNRRTYDVFVSYAGEDRGFVEDLVLEIANRGLQVWYDRFCLAPGDSIARSVDEGLANSRLGIVVLSQHFFQKAWPQRELGALMHRRLVPIWHNLTAEEVEARSPLLADKWALQSAWGTADIAQAVVATLRPEGFVAKSASFAALLALSEAVLEVVDDALDCDTATAESLLGTLQTVRNGLSAVIRATHSVALAESHREVIDIVARARAEVFGQTEAYCVTCGREIDQVNRVQAMATDGSAKTQGLCPICGTYTSRSGRAG